MNICLRTTQHAHSKHYTALYQIGSNHTPSTKLHSCNTECQTLFSTQWWEWYIHVPTEPSFGSNGVAVGNHTDRDTDYTQDMLVDSRQAWVHPGGL